MLEWAFRRNGTLAADDHLESMISGRLRAMTIEEAPAQLRLRGWMGVAARLPLFRTTWMIYRSRERLFVGAGSGLLMPIDLAYLWRISIDQNDVLTLVYSAAGLTAVRFEKSRRDKTTRSTWATEWVEEVTTARERLASIMTVEQKSWYGLWRTELEESGALDRVESMLGDSEDILAPRDSVDSDAWHLLLAALGSVGRSDTHGLALALKRAVEVNPARGALATAYARFQLASAITERLGAEATPDRIDELARSSFERWSGMLSSVANYEGSVLCAALREAAGHRFDVDALDGRRAQATLTALGVLLDNPVPYLVAARKSVSDWAKRERLDAKTAPSIAELPAREGADLETEWSVLARAVTAGAYGDTHMMIERLVEHEKTFDKRARRRVMVYLAIRALVLRRLEGRGSRNDLAMLAAEAAPRYSRLLNKMELVDLEEILEYVFSFREVNDHLKGNQLMIRGSGALAVLLTNPAAELDAISSSVLEKTAAITEAGRE